MRPVWGFASSRAPTAWQASGPTPGSVSWGSACPDTWVPGRGPEGLQGQLDRQAALCHRDSVVALAALDLGERLLLSGSLDGVVKAWK